MPSIVIERFIATDAQTIYNALTQQDKIARWWTNDLNVKPEVGSLAEFRFRQEAFIIQLEIAALDAGKKVYWIIKKGAPHWTDTSVTWQLTPVETGTKVFFSHDGFARNNEPFEQTRRNWEYFLDSLKSYLETGKGTPGLPMSV